MGKSLSLLTSTINQGINMQVSLVITILGPDQSGLVKSLSETLNRFQGNWTESRMSHLAGKFAGILQVSVPTDQVDELTAALQALQSDGLQVSIEKADQDSATSTSSTNVLSLELLGQDRPGIIRDITEQLARLAVNIEELESQVKEASMSGGTLFCAQLKLSLPNNVTTEAVQDSLESMSDQFMVDINFS
jgi:glycine cleavage system regulatory protein